MIAFIASYKEIEKLNRLEFMQYTLESRYIKMIRTRLNRRTGDTEYIDTGMAVELIPTREEFEDFTQYSLDIQEGILWRTVNHCDLYCNNAAIKNHGLACNLKDREAMIAELTH
jgi:hypothetical protein